MELDENQKPELSEEVEATDFAEDPLIEVSTKGVREASSKVAPLIFGTLLMAAGVLIFGWLRWGMSWGPRCRPDDLSCTPPWLGAVIAPGLYAGSLVGAAVDWIRGRCYTRWLFAAGALLWVAVVVRLLKIWFLSN